MGEGLFNPSIHGLLWAIFLLVVDELGEANAITSFHEGELIEMLRVSGLWLVLRPYGDRNSGRKGQRGASARNAKQCLKKNDPLSKTLLLRVFGFGSVTFDNYSFLSLDPKRLDRIFVFLRI